MDGLLVGRDDANIEGAQNGQGARQGQGNFGDNQLPFNNVRAPTIDADGWRTSWMTHLDI